MVEARGADGVSWGGAKGGGGVGDDTAANGWLCGNDGEVWLAVGEGGENQLEVAGDRAGDDGGSAVGDGSVNAVGGEGGNAVWDDGGDDGAGVAGVKGGCEEEGGEGGDITVGEEGDV